MKKNVLRLKKNRKNFPKIIKKKIFRKKISFQFGAKLHLLIEIRRFPPISARVTSNNPMKMPVKKKKGQKWEKFSKIEIFRFLDQQSRKSDVHSEVYLTEIRHLPPIVGRIKANNTNYKPDHDFKNHPL